MSITEPGVYDLPANEYYADPIDAGSLSQSMAKVLLDEGGPARFIAQQDGPREDKAVFDRGTSIHALILGKGSERIVEIEADSWRTKEAQRQRKTAYTVGLTPRLTKELDADREVADAVPAYVKKLLAGGLPEHSMFWKHHTGLWLRGQMDMYKPGEAILDLKTAADTTTRGLQRAIWDKRYYVQAAWYRRGVEAITGERLPYYVIAIETAPPYLCRVVEIADHYLARGERDMDRAIATYLQCAETGHWPGHPQQIEPFDGPPWADDDLADDTITALQNMIGETP